MSTTRFLKIKQMIDMFNHHIRFYIHDISLFLLAESRFALCFRNNI